MCERIESLIVKASDNIRKGGEVLPEKRERVFSILGLVSSEAYDHQHTCFFQV